MEWRCGKGNERCFRWDLDSCMKALMNWLIISSKVKWKWKWQGLCKKILFWKEKWKVCYLTIRWCGWKVRYLSTQNLLCCRQPDQLFSSCGDFITGVFQLKTQKNKNIYFHNWPPEVAENYKKVRYGQTLVTFLISSKCFSSNFNINSIQRKSITEKNSHEQF